MPLPRSFSQSGKFSTKISLLAELEHAEFTAETQRRGEFMELIPSTHDIFRLDESLNGNLCRPQPNHQAMFWKAILGRRVVSNDGHEQNLFRVVHKYFQSQNCIRALRKSIGLDSFVVLV